MRRRAGAVLLGIIVAIVVLAVLELGVYAIEGPPPGTDLSDPARMQAWVAAMPASTHLLLIGAGLLAGLAGGWASGRAARELPAFHGLLVGVVFALAGLARALSIAHPPWVVLASLLAQLGGPVIGARLSGARSAGAD